MRREIVLVFVMAVVADVAGATGRCGSTPTALATPAAGTRATISAVGAGIAPVQGLLVMADPTYRGAVRLPGKVRIITLAGKSLVVPERVREYPLGLSPDGRFVAGLIDPTRFRSRGAVVMGPVAGGPIRTVLQGDCPSPPCAPGTDPSYAWSPDSQHLAAAANPAHGPTLLRLVDRNGRVLRSFSLARTDSHGERAYHHLESWSPDRSRLLLTQQDKWGYTAAVVLDVSTGRSRILARLGFCDTPSLSWSPDGRFVALESDGIQDCDDHFAIIDATTNRQILKRSWLKGYGQSGTIWAPDSPSVFGAFVNVPSNNANTTGTTHEIDRVYLTGRRTAVITSRNAWLTPRVGLISGLVYQSSFDHGPTLDTLYLHHFRTGNDDLLASSQNGIDDVLPLPRLP